MEGINDVADLRRTIKLAMAPKFDKYATTDLTIRAALMKDKEGSKAAELRAGDTLKEILDHFKIIDLKKPFVKLIQFFVYTYG